MQAEQNRLQEIGPETSSSADVDAATKSLNAILDRQQEIVDRLAELENAINRLS